MQRLGDLRIEEQGRYKFRRKQPVAIRMADLSKFREEDIEWALARRPEIGSMVTTDDPPVWFIPTVSVDRVTPLTVYYTFDTERVYLLSIQSAIGTSN
jgi:hypothetical protein